jgi:hypothetical protein
VGQPKIILAEVFELLRTDSNILPPLCVCHLTAPSSIQDGGHLAQILTAATLHRVFQHLLGCSVNFFFSQFVLVRHIMREKNHIKIFCSKESVLKIHYEISR